MEPKRTFENGYREGWAATTDERLSDAWTCQPANDQHDYQAGFEYGRADALDRAKL